MPISITCPSCAVKMRAPDHAAGRSTKCPKCGAALVVPGKPAAPPANFTSSSAVPSSASGAQMGAVAEWRRKRGAANGRMIALVGGLVLIGIAIGGVAVWAFLPREPAAKGDNGSVASADKPKPAPLPPAAKEEGKRGPEPKKVPDALPAQKPAPPPPAPALEPKADVPPEPKVETRVEPDATPEAPVDTVPENASQHTLQTLKDKLAQRRVGWERGVAMANRSSNPASRQSAMIQVSINDGAAKQEIDAIPEVPAISKHCRRLFLTSGLTEKTVASLEIWLETEKGVLPAKVKEMRLYEVVAALDKHFKDKP